MNNVQAESKTLKAWLSGEYNLKQRFVKGSTSYYRLWQTIEILSPTGELVARNQWRGDLKRVVESVSSAGKAIEQITWNTVGVRFWLMAEGKYGPAAPLLWTTGFNYMFSVEDGFDELQFDYRSIPKTLAGSTFRQAFQVSAHFEFDFLRSSRHAAIEKLRRPGDILLKTPGDGQEFSLSFPPVITNSRLVKENTQIGFLGLTLVEDAPCGIIDYRQGPQVFRWETTDPEFSKICGAPAVKTWYTELVSWQQGQIFIRLEDGSLAEGEFLENHMLNRRPLESGDPNPAYSRGIWGLRQITEQDYQNELSGWDADQSPAPWHCLYDEFRLRP